jgi:antitoxin (DNA-binding transcriptional repressor) of toxin-antitoxin stability system
METISISKLKTHLSAELKKVQKGTSIVILDHKHPVARLVPAIGKEVIFAREANTAYEYKKLEPLTDADLIKDIEDEREDRW